MLKGSSSTQQQPPPPLCHDAVASTDLKVSQALCHCKLFTSHTKSVYLRRMTCPCSCWASGRSSRVLCFHQ